MEFRLTQLHLTILNFVLIAALAIVSALTVKSIYERAMTKEAVDEPVASAPTRAPHGARSRAYYQAIVKRDIFNLVPQDSAPAPVVVEDLHLKLLGTSTLTKSKPFAIVEDQGGQQALYQVGDEIPDAGKLVAVERTRAIIERGGRRVAIEIPATQIPEAGPSGVTPGPAIRVRPMTPHRKAGRATPTRPANAAADSDDDADTDSDDDSDTDTDSDDSSSQLNLKKVAPGKFEASRAEVAKTLQNPGQLFSQMRALPHFANGKADGFNISQVAPGSVFEQLGIKNGDMITAIDGEPVTNPMQAMGLMQAVQTRPSIDLTVNRNGASMPLHLDLR